MHNNYYVPLMIPARFLIGGNYYAGTCRNANIARWNAETQLFTHWREKHGHKFTETIEYWLPEGRYDGFVPLFNLGSDAPQPITLKE